MQKPSGGIDVLLVGQAQLEQIVVAPIYGWRVAMREKFTSRCVACSASHHRLSGEAANDNRQLWAKEQRGVTEASNLNYYAGLYPGIRQMMPVSFDDEMGENSLALTMQYLIPAAEMFANGLREDFPFRANDYGTQLLNAQAGVRSVPLLMGGQRYQTYDITIENAPINFEAPDSVSITNEAFFYRFTGRTCEQGKLRLSWQFRCKDRVTAP